MLIQYLKKKETNQKAKAEIIYKEIINKIDKFTNNSNFSIKKEFDTSFELTILHIFIVFFLNKKKSALNQEILNIFIKDLDYSFRRIGISDMKIGKYVKKYIKKIYYRFNKLEKIFTDSNFKEFKKYVYMLNILSLKHEYDEFSEHLYIYLQNYLNDFKNLEKV